MDYGASQSERDILLMVATENPSLHHDQRALKLTGRR
jgi:hypothetical protein